MASSRERAVAVLFDSNFLMTAARLHFDIFHRVEQTLDSPYEARILSANLHELTTLAEHGAPLTRRYARVALKLAESCKIMDSPSGSKDPDDVILQFASKSADLIVATNDAALRTRLRRSNLPVVSLSRGGRLVRSGLEA